MYSASSPPVKNMMKAVTPYKMPIFLWSIVVSQSQMPVGWDGRFGRGIASVFMGFLLTSGRSLQALDIPHQRRYLSFGQLQRRVVVHLPV